MSSQVCFLSPNSYKYHWWTANEARRIEPVCSGWSEVFTSFERLRNESSVHYFHNLIMDTNLDLLVLSAKLSSHTPVGVRIRDAILVFNVL